MFLHKVFTTVIFRLNIIKHVHIALFLTSNVDIMAGLHDLMKAVIDYRACEQILTTYCAATIFVTYYMFDTETAQLLSHYYVKSI